MNKDILFVLEIDGKPVAIYPESKRVHHRRLIHLSGITERLAKPGEETDLKHLKATKRERERERESNSAFLVNFPWSSVHGFIEEAA